MRTPTRTAVFLFLIFAVHTALLAQPVPEQGGVSIQPTVHGGESSAVQAQGADVAVPVGLFIKSHAVEAVRAPHLSERLQQHLQQMLDVTHDQDQTLTLEVVAQQLTQIYRSWGYPLAVVKVQPEDLEAALTTQKLRWSAFRGEWGRIAVLNTSRMNTRRLQLALAQGWCGAGSAVQVDDAVDLSSACQGSPVVDSALQRGLLLVVDRPGIQTEFPQFGPGTELGQADATIKVSDISVWPLKLSIEQDNHGARVTGTQRTAITVASVNALGFNEQISHSEQVTRLGTKNSSTSTGFPVGNRGWLVSYAHGTLNYVLGGGVFAGSVQGLSKTTTLSATYPLVRTFDETLRLNTSYQSVGNASNYYSGLLTTHSQMKRWTVGIQRELDERRQALSPYVTSHTLWSLQLTQGHANMDADSAQSDASGPQVAGRYIKLNYALSHRQALDGQRQWALQAHVRGQLANKNLDGSEKFSLGGPTAVRAYPHGEVSSDVGHLVSVELRRYRGTAATHVHAGLFIDYGSGQLGKTEWAPGATQRYSLSSFGLNIEGVARSAWGMGQYGLTWATQGMKKRSGIEPDVQQRWWLYWRWSL